MNASVDSPHFTLLIRKVCSCGVISWFLVMTRSKQLELIREEREPERSSHLSAADMSRRARVFITHSEIPDTVLALLREKCELIICSELPTPSRADIVRNVREVDAIFWCTQNRLDSEIMDLAGAGLRVIATASAGYEHVDVAEARRRGIQLGYTPNVNTKAVAEIGVALLLEVARRIPEARQCIYE